MEENRMTGRVTIPTDLDVVPETLQILKKWGADAIRDCDGTDFPQELKDADAKIYSTYYTTRKDNAWAKANPDEVQQCYIMTGFYTAPGDTVTIPLMKGISPELMQVNTNDDITRWWEVMHRTTGQPVPPELWSYADGSVTVQAVPSVFWLTSSGIRCICTTLPPTAGRILSTRSPLTCVSPRPTSIPWSACASSLQSTPM